ncbi:MAG: lipid II flippase MurJ, partial [Ilumatobacteraceae bacterium]
MTEPLPGATTTGRLQRDALVVTVCTLVSRITGFGRVLATAAVLGSGLLGDVYQTANLVPNLLFELVALGVLQAVLVPAFAAAQRDGRNALDAAVRAATGAALVALGVVAVAGIATSPLLAQVMVAFEPAPEIAADKLDVMVPMVLVFVPQLVFYGLATVTSAALNAQGRFVAGALAPAANNVVVILACLLFRWARDGAVADLDLSEVEFSLIAGGTTAGVACLA